MNAAELDAALIAARAGDQQATTKLFRAFHPPLLHYVRHRAPDVAEDLVSEVWMAAAKTFPNFEGDATDFRAWLFSVARRRIADHYRTKARRPATVELDASNEQDVPDETDALLERLSTDRAIESLVHSLSEEQREVVVLRVVAGLSVEQVANITKRTPGSVRVIQHRALRRLGEVLDRGAVTR